MPGSSEPPNEKDDFKDGLVERPICNRRIAHTITAIIEYNRDTTICTLKIRITKKYFGINPFIVHCQIFDTIKNINDTVAIISPDLPTEYVLRIVKTPP